MHARLVTGHVSKWLCKQLTRLTIALYLLDPMQLLSISYTSLKDGLSSDLQFKTDKGHYNFFFLIFRGILILQNMHAEIINTI